MDWKMLVLAFFLASTCGCDTRSSINPGGLLGTIYRTFQITHSVDQCRAEAGFFDGKSGKRWMNIDAKRAIEVCDTGEIRAGNSETIFLVRALLKNGRSEEAFNLLNVSSSKNETAFKSYLAILSDNNIQPSSQPASTESLYQSAVDENDPEAAVRLGWLEEQSGGEEGKGRAFALYSRAASMHYYLGYSAVGLAYERGVGVTQDQGRAVHFYYKAAEAGDDWSKMRLGVLLASGKLKTRPPFLYSDIEKYTNSYRTSDSIIASILKGCRAYDVDLSESPRVSWRPVGLS